MIFALFYAVGALLAAGDAIGLMRPRAPRTPNLPAWIWACTLAVAFACQLVVELHAATYQLPAPTWLRVVPIPIVTRAMEHPDAIAFGTIALCALQSYALLGLYRSAPSRGVVVVAFGAMAGMSFGAPALTNGDVYAYVGNALLGLAAYAPPAHPFPGAFGTINDLWHEPMTATTYGPLWLLAVRAMTAAGATLFAKLVLLRAAGLALLVAFVAALHYLGMPRRLVAVAALNPALHLEFVSNAHNDMLVLAVLALGALAARRNPALAGVAIVAAGLIKLPYVLLGLPILARASASARLPIAAMSVVAVALLSWMWGGPAYARALTAYIAGAPTHDLVHALVALAAVAVLLLGVVRRRRIANAIWLMPSLGAYIDSWYLGWSLPYALERRRSLSFALVTFPLAAALLDLTIVRDWSIALIVIIGVGLALSSLLARARWSSWS